MLLNPRKAEKARTQEAVIRCRAIEVLYAHLRGHLVATGKMTRHQLDMWEAEVGSRELAKLGIKVARVQVGKRSEAGLVDPSGAPVVVGGPASPLAAAGG